MEKKSNLENEIDLSDQKDIDLQESEESEEQDNSNQEEDEEEEEDEIINIDELEEYNDEINNLLESANNPENLINNINKNLKYNSDDLKLETLDLNIVSKEDAVNFLLYKTKLDNTTKSNSPATKRKINKNRYNKVKSMINKESHKPNYLLNMETNPERTYDFQTALTRVVASKMNDKNEDNNLKKALISKRKVKNIKTVNNF